MEGLRGDFHTGMAKGRNLGLFFGFLFNHFVACLAVLYCVEAEHEGRRKVMPVCLMEEAEEDKDNDFDWHRNLLLAELLDMGRERVVAGCKRVVGCIVVREGLEHLAL